MTTPPRTLAFLLCALPFLAQAQGPTEPPVYLRFLRTLGRPDMPLIQSYAAAQADVTVIAATSISGDPETWLLESHDSFASIEDLDQKLSIETDARPSRRTRSMASSSNGSPFSWGVISSNMGTCLRGMPWGRTSAGMPGEPAAA